MSVNIVLSMTLLLASACSERGDKRLVLNDPQFVSQQLQHQLQSKMEALEQKMNSQQTIIDDLHQKLTSSNRDEVQAAINNKILELQQAVKLLDQKQKQHAIGTSFVRWGRADCPANISTLVYEGFAGGSYYRNPGAASNYVCLPRNASYGAHKYSQWRYGNAGMFGAEYEDFSLFQKANSHSDVPCAVCHSTQHSDTLMIPGTTSCFSGWTQAYEGILAEGHYDHNAASEYVCVDLHPETTKGGSSENEDGKLFYGVKTVCGSLPCPPYKNNLVMSCSVCMK